MQMNQLSIEYRFHGRIRRIGKQVLHCLVVFPNVEDDAESLDRLRAYMVVARTLPDFVHVKYGHSMRYSDLLFRPFQVMNPAAVFGIWLAVWGARKGIRLLLDLV